MGSVFVADGMLVQFSQKTIAYLSDALTIAHIKSIFLWCVSVPYRTCLVPNSRSAVPNVLEDKPHRLNYLRQVMKIILNT